MNIEVLLVYECIYKVMYMINDNLQLLYIFKYFMV